MSNNTATIKGSRAVLVAWKSNPGPLAVIVGGAGPADYLIREYNEVTGTWGDEESVWCALIRDCPKDDPRLEAATKAVDFDLPASQD